MTVLDHVPGRCTATGVAWTPSLSCSRSQACCAGWPGISRATPLRYGPSALVTGTLRDPATALWCMHACPQIKPDRGILELHIASPIPFIQVLLLSPAVQLTAAGGTCFAYPAGWVQSFREERASTEACTTTCLAPMHVACTMLHVMWQHVMRHVLHHVSHIMLSCYVHFAGGGAAAAHAAH